FWFTSERIERKPHHCCRNARAAAGNDRSLDVDAAGRESLPEPVGRNQSAVLDQSGVGHIERAGNVAGAHARSRLRRIAAEAVGGLRIDDLSSTYLECGLDVSKSSNDINRLASMEPI